MEKTTKINDNLTLIQSSQGLTFGSDAYLLSAFVSGDKNQVGADLGSGTGIISLLCASRKKASRIYSIEVQDKFADIIGRNAEANGMGEIIKPICADLRELKASDVDGEVDFVTANPPYMKLDSGKRNEHDEKFIARHEVCGGIGDFCACAYRLLKHGGKFYVVWRPDRLVDLICALRENHLEPKLITFVCATPESEPSMVLVRSLKGAASGSVVTRTLFLHDDKQGAIQSKLSADAEKIYESCSFSHFK